MRFVPLKSGAGSVEVELAITAAVRSPAIIASLGDEPSGAMSAPSGGLVMEILSSVGPMSKNKPMLAIANTTASAIPRYATGNGSVANWPPIYGFGCGSTSVEAGASVLSTIAVAQPRPCGAQVELSRSEL